jgi:hypothetical protein
MQNSDFSEQRNLFVLMMTRETANVLRMVHQYSQQYDKVAIELELAPETVVWADHAIPVATIRFTGFPRGVADPKKAVLREIKNGLRMQVVWENGEIVAKDIAVEGLGPGGPGFGGPPAPGSGMLPGGGPLGGNRRPIRNQ